MPDYLIVLLAIILLVFSILLSVKRNINIGVPAIGCAFFLGVCVLRLPSNDLLEYIPVNVIFVTVAGGMFFGYAIQNGAIQNLAHHVLYR